MKEPLKKKTVSSAWVYWQQMPSNRDEEKAERVPPKNNKS